MYAHLVVASKKRKVSTVGREDNNGIGDWPDHSITDNSMRYDERESQAFTSDVQIFRSAPLQFNENQGNLRNCRKLFETSLKADFGRFVERSSFRRLKPGNERFTTLCAWLCTPVGVPFISNERLRFHFFQP